MSPNCCQFVSVMSLLKNRIEPSARAALTPPLWRLRAALERAALAKRTARA